MNKEFKAFIFGIAQGIAVLCVAFFTFQALWAIGNHWYPARKLTGSIIAPFSQFGTCTRCNRPWNRVEAHYTEYRELVEGKDYTITGNTSDILAINVAGGMFPMCQNCWSELRPAQRIPFYDKLIDMWKDGGSDISPDEISAIHAAVLAGE